MLASTSPEGRGFKHLTGKQQKALPLGRAGTA
nr:MAG TPA: hypothetical protein [Caudoviricetes sp.]